MQGNFTKAVSVGEEGGGLHGALLHAFAQRGNCDSVWVGGIARKFGSMN